jgi:ceramide glucosyltransferase
MNSLPIVSLGWMLMIAAGAYVMLAIVAQWVWSLRRTRLAPDAPNAPAVSVLIPLCGGEPRLYENLRGFCVQDHPNYQIVFGTRSADDPALDIARRLQAELPQRDIAVICDPRVHGPNLKVSNLANLLPHARHPVLVMVDSDIVVDPQYLARVTRPLMDPRIGLVTCLYRGRSLPGLWSRLGKQFIDDWFRPAVLIAWLFGSDEVGFGSTLALTRRTLDDIGGFPALLPHLADDHALSALIRERGLQTVLSEQEVGTDVTERSLPALALHELRWLRTIRFLHPLAYLGLLVTFTVPVALAGWSLSDGGDEATLLLAAALALRVLLHWPTWRAPRSLRDIGAGLADLPLLALRDTLSLIVWFTGLLGRRVRWRGHTLLADAGPARPLTHVSSEVLERQ